MEDNLGIMGTNIPVSYEMTDTNQAISEGSLPKFSAVIGRHFYVWGEITYDLFSKDKKHFTSFCLLNAADQLAPCSNGNDAD